MKPLISRAIFSLTVVLFFVLALPSTARAACTSPAGSESQTLYDFTNHVLKYCDNTSWLTFAAGAAAATQWSNGGGGAIYYNGGNVGIGTTSPLTKLTVEATNPYMSLNASTAGKQTGLLFYNNATLQWHLGSNYDNAGDANFFIQRESGSGNFILAPNGNGNVGIGTAAPGGIFEVRKDATYNVDTGAGLRLASATTATKMLAAGYDVSLDASYIQSLQSGAGYKPLLLNPNAGNVGIGTTNPSNTLDVKGDTGIRTYDTTATTTLSLYTQSASNRAVIQSSAGKDLAFFVNGGGTEAIRILNSGNVGIGTTSPSNYKLVVQPDANGRGLKVAAGLTIGNSGGNYGGIGYNVRYTGTSDLYQYDIGDKASMMRFGRSGVGIETFTTGTTGAGGNTISFVAGPYVADGGTSWTNSSDVRLKKNIRPLSVLDRLKEYRAVSFDWTETGQHDVGVIAQEIYSIFPEVVNKGSSMQEAPEIRGTDAGRWGVQYDKLGALALQAAKELKADNDNLRDELKAANDNLRILVEEQGRAIEELKQTR